MMARSLDWRYITRLKAFQCARRLSTAQLKLTMAAPFSAATLQKALYGMPTRWSTYRFIVAWVDRNLRVKEVPDGKNAAANDAVPCSE